MKRREFIVNFSMATGGLLISNVMMPKAWAQTAANNEVLITIFLRGGWDALNVLPPNAGGDLTKYQELRPSVNFLGSSNVTPLNGVNFGMNKSLGDYLRPLWDSGKLAIIPRAGSLNNTRSHFVQQDLIESGSSTEVLAKGILASASSLVPADSMTPSTYMAFGLGTPHAFRGGSAVVMEDLHSFGTLSTTRAIAAETVDQKLARYRLDPKNANCERAEGERTVDFYLCRNSQRGVGVHSTFANYKSQVSKVLPPSFTNDAFGRAMYQASQLIKIDSKVKFINIDQGGYDTHFNEMESLPANLDKLGKNLKALTDQLSSDNTYQRVTILVMSEFGRTTHENKSGGTDHGRAGLALVLGGAVQGKAGLSYAPRGSWALRSSEMSVGSSNALELDAATAPQHDLRHIMARILTRVTGQSYANVAGLFTGAALPGAAQDNLKIYG